jgi:hypothetical protein
MVIREDPFNNPNYLRRYPINLIVEKAFAQTATMTVQPYAPNPPANFSFAQITVKDLITQIVYTWTNGSWDNQPYVTPGNGMLIIDIFVINLGGTISSGQVTVKDSSGNTLHSQATPNASIGVVYEMGAFSINMPTTPYTLTVSVTP